MESVQGMSVEEGVEKPRATNVAYNNHFTGVETDLLEGPV
jgi:hypothetical protein